MLQTRYAGHFFYLVMMLMVLVSKEGESATHRWKAFPKVYSCIVHSLKLVKKQVKVGWAYILQLSIVDSSCIKDLPFKPMQGSYSSDSSDKQDFGDIES